MMKVGFAFFDVDETLLTFKSMFEFRHRLFLHSANGESAVADERYEQFMAEIQALSIKYDRAWINRWFYRSLEGQHEAEIRNLAYRWYAELAQLQVPLFVQETVNLLERLRHQGFEPVAVSGSAELFIAPFLQALKITQHLCIRLDKSPEGVLTGKLLEPQTIGIGKQQAVLGFLARHDIAPSVCFAVGDHHTDLPMLELVGHPVVVAGDLTLEALAKLRHWPVLRPQLNRLNLIKWSQPAPQHN